MAIEQMDQSADTPAFIPSQSDKSWHFWLLSIAGGIISVIPDCIQNDNAALIPKMCDKLLSKHFLVPPNIAPFIALLIIMLISVVVCIVYMPRTRVDAFARGAAVLVLLTSGFTYDPAKIAPTPNDIKSNEREETKAPQIRDEPIKKLDSRIEAPQTNQKLGELSQGDKKVFSDILERLTNLLLSDAYAAEHDISYENLGLDLKEGFSNATVLKNEWVSMAKPSFSGPFGLGSLFGNTINILRKDYSLEKNERVRILEVWDTGFRSYRYIKIQYKRNGKILKGWIWAGKKPNPWLVVKPDNPDTPLAEDLMIIAVSKSQLLLDEFEKSNSNSAKKKIISDYLKCFEFISFNLEIENPDHDEELKLLRTIHEGYWNSGMEEFERKNKSTDTEMGKNS